MRSLHCERSRAWISVGLDGELSELESIHLDRHLGRCASCRAFAVDAGAATRLLRGAPLEALDLHVDLPGRISARRRGAAAVAIATAAAGLAAALALHPGAASQRETAHSSAAVARPAGLALVSYDAANLGVRRSDARGVRLQSSDLVRGSFQLPTF